ncbi:hypothetical protein AVEN_44033-1 [Araneus ventricosus]|uniref:Uncharacterized protein n=1 Tax=Araneus ventricosus TaxID=182803 RepID=A0A4Y2HAG7_ARAVE|nr:hypothetical protein AVEN_44033-1 [Araneus ventricosus]
MLLFSFKSRGRGDLVIKPWLWRWFASGSKPDSTDHSCESLVHAQSDFGVKCPGVVWALGEEVPAQASSSSYDGGNKFCEMRSKRVLLLLPNGRLYN